MKISLKPKIIKWIFEWKNFSRTRIFFERDTLISLVRMRN
jgi:hypothetical protein